MELEKMSKKDLILSVKKAASKLAYVHMNIDLYCTATWTHEDDYWLDYLTDPTWGDEDIGWEAKESEEENYTDCENNDSNIDRNDQKELLKLVGDIKEYRNNDVGIWNPIIGHELNF